MASRKLEQLEKIADKLGLMDRPDLIEELRRLRCSFRMDFSPEFLDSVSVDRLRHIVLAASLHDRQDKETAVS